MSANGLVVFVVIYALALLVPSSEVVPIAPSVLGLALTLALGRRAPRVILRALLSVLPVAVLLMLLWVGLIGHAPDEMPFYRPMATPSPLSAVIAITSRLFLLAWITLAVSQVAALLRPSFISALALPVDVKASLLAATSLVGVMRQGAIRAHTALVAANVLTGRASLRNLGAGWILLRTTWVAVVGIVAEQLDGKWRYEKLPASAVEGSGRRRLGTWGDVAWISAALIVLCERFYHLHIGTHA
jgi:hypothetical protein